MPRFGYSCKVEEPCARAMGKELRISPKDAVEICREIRGMGLREAQSYLQEVAKGKRAVPFRRHAKKVAHHRGTGGAGAYPVKAAKAILQVLKNAEANAVYKGLNTEKLRVVHASASKGITLPGILPRAFGRATPYNKPLTNVQIVLKEA
ncbi:MAG: 50S ribosomal protein L22 [Hadesarchaea archaeon]|jgi:large subunit ribosomal protein L22|nr:50S ribosomal protein L22 [Hadesarchaea archaeon]TDA31671.1 MAG: 50S ribosomal protein L22 [Hadesarchaea archaeon]